MASGHKLEDERRVLTKAEAHQQMGRSASLLQMMFEYTAGMKKRE